MLDIELTPSERVLIKHLCLVGTNKNIASLMNISEQTVKCHIRNIIRHTGLKNRTLLAVWAIRNGLDKWQ